MVSLTNSDKLQSPKQQMALIDASVHLSTDIGDKYDRFLEFLQDHTHKDSDQPITHVSIVNPRGKFSWDRDANELFWDLYSHSILQPENVIALAEKPETYYPVLVDIDIKVPYDPEIHHTGENGTRLYTQAQAQSVVKIYQSVLKECLQRPEEKHLFVILLEKKSARIDNTWFKDGFHAQFLFTQLHRDDHKAEILPRVKREIQIRKVFESSGIQNSQDAVDDVNGKPWLLYGSRKAANQESYSITRLFGLMNPATHDLESFPKECLPQKLKQYGYSLCTSDSHPIALEETNFEFHIPRILSISPLCNRIAISPLKKTLNIGIIKEMERYETIKENDKFQNVEENLQKAQALMPLLSAQRASNYDSWIEVGYTLFSISQGCDIGYKLWLEFSQKTTHNNFSARHCAVRWTSMKNSGKTIASLMYFAKQDSPEAYASMKKRENTDKLEMCIGGTHWDIAQWIFHLYQDNFVCVNPKMSIWYKFKGGLWSEDNNSVLLKRLISTVLYQEISSKSKKDDVSSNNYRDYQKLLTNLKTGKFKRDVVKECLSAGTLITLADGSQAKIEDLTHNHQILSFNIAQAHFTKDEIVATKKTATRACFEISLLDGKKLTCTGDHPILTSTNDWVHAQDLTQDCAVITSLDTDVSIQATADDYDSSSSSTLLEISDLTHPALKLSKFRKLQSLYISLYPIINSYQTKFEYSDMVSTTLKFVRIQRSCYQDALLFQNDLLTVCPWLECTVQKSTPVMCTISFVSDHDSSIFIACFGIDSTANRNIMMQNMYSRIINLSVDHPVRLQHFKRYFASLCSNAEVKINHQNMRFIDPMQIKFEVTSKEYEMQFLDFAKSMVKELSCIGVHASLSKSVASKSKPQPYPRICRMSIEINTKHLKHMQMLAEIGQMIRYDLITRTRLHLVTTYCNMKSNNSLTPKFTKMTFKDYIQLSNSFKYFFDESIQKLGGLPCFSIPVLSVLPKSEPVDVYDISVKNNKNMTANGIVVHNCEQLFYREDFMTKLDNNFDLLNFDNGVMDLRTLKFRKAVATDYLSKTTGYDYQEYTMQSNEVHEVLNYLSEILPDPQLRTYFVEYLANCTRGSNAHKLFVVMSGHGNGGKSVAMQIVQKMFGNYFVVLPPSLVTDNRPGKAGDATPEYTSLPGARIVHMAEPNGTEIFNLGKLKNLTGEDTLWCRPLFREGYLFRPQFHLCLSCNEWPRVPSNDGATWNRIRVIVFESLFLINPADVPSTREEQMKQKIFLRNLNSKKTFARLHQPFIWLLMQTLNKISQFGSSPEPEKVQLATSTYRKDNDVTLQFIEEKIWFQDSDSEITVNDLYNEYKLWSRSGHAFIVSLPKKKFIADVSTRWGKPLAGYCWKGRRIKTDDDMALLVQKEMSSSQSANPHT